MNTDKNDKKEAPHIKHSEEHELKCDQRHVLSAGWVRQIILYGGMGVVLLVDIGADCDFFCARAFDSSSGLCVLFWK